jgi:GntR family transcriptional regulator
VFLPSEAHLADDFGVSRMTVRHALAGLASRGLIERRHGLGTRVIESRLERLETSQPIGLAEELMSRGITPGSRVLELEEIRVPDNVREDLWLGPRAVVVRLVRLRYADGRLIGLQESVMPSRFCPGLDKVDLDDVSLTHVLRSRYGLAIARADVTIDAVEASPEQSGLLDLTVGAPLLRTKRITYLTDERPLERTIGWFHTSRYSLVLHQTGGQYRASKADEAAQDG